MHKGDPLVEISSDQNSAALGDTHALVGQQLALQQQHLQQDLQTQQLQTQQQAGALRTKVTLLKAQQAQLSGQWLRWTIDKIKLDWGETISRPLVERDMVWRKNLTNKAANRQK